MDVAQAHAAFTERFRAGAGAFTEFVAEADPDLPVPTCPGWTVRDLIWHTGGIHVWAAAAVREARAAEETHAGPPDAELRDWYAACAAELSAALGSAPLEQEVWSFGPRPRRAVFWSRRQAHEVTMHLWDGHHALGRDLPLDGEFAADGIDEVVTMFFPRQVRLERIPPLTRSLRLTDDTGRSWWLGPEGEEPEATVSGPSTALLLLLWRRAGLDHPALALQGDETAARAVLGAGLTP